MGRPTTSNANAFDRKQSSTQTHSDSAYSHSQASTVDTSFTEAEVSMFQSQADAARQKRRGRGDASIRDSRSSRMYNSAYETQSSMHNVNTTDPFPPTEHKSKEKSGSGRKGEPLMGSLRGGLARSSKATSPPSHRLPSVTSPRSDYQHLSGSHGRADDQLSESSYQGTRLYEPTGPPPTQSSPLKQSSWQSSESGPEAVNCNVYYHSGGPLKSHETSSNTESGSVDCEDFYNSPTAFPLSGGQRKLGRDVYAASENIRADRNRIEGIENPYHIRIDDVMNEMAPHPEELDDLSLRIVGDFSGLYYGREHYLPRL